MRIYTILIFIIVFVPNSFGQTASQRILALSDSLDRLSINRPTESVYINTNKDVFEKGENLWFSAAVLNTQLLAPSNLSTTLFVELRSDEDDKEIYQELFPVKGGFSDGHLFLPDSLSTGVYWLTCFTANSLKFEHSTIKSVRKIMIKEEVIPQILIQTKFGKEAYAIGDRVSGELKLFTPGGELVRQAKTILQLKKGAKVQERIRVKSDSLGSVPFGFKASVNPSEMTLIVRVDHDESEVLMTIPIPYNPSSTLQLNLLPEGGNLVAGMINRVAFKAVDLSGEPVKIGKAALYANGEEIIDFGSEHAGMGSFSFFAEKGKDYSVKVIEPAVDSLYQLPQVYNEGFQLKLRKQSKRTLDLEITKSSGVKRNSIHLVVKQHGMVKWAGSGNVKDYGLLIQVPSADLPQGIVEVTLYDQHFLPVAERLVYVNHHRRLQISMVVDKRQYGIKEKVKLNLKVTDEEGNPIQTSFTISAVDELYDSQFAEKNIMSHFLLENELRGRLFEPAYYFDEKNEHAMKHLDLLMMTQGWRAYSWKTLDLIEDEKSQALELFDFAYGQIDPKSLSAKARKKKDQEIQMFGDFGAMVVKADSSWRFPILTSIFPSTDSASLAFNVQGQEDAKISFITAFDYTMDNRQVGRLEYGYKRHKPLFRNWEKLAQSTADVRKLDEVEVIAHKVNHQKQQGLAQGIYYGSPSDWVCHNRILNCRNHLSGSMPIEGVTYQTNFGYKTYRRPDKFRDQHENSFEGYYRTPKFYEPDYDTKPLEREIPDFRNTLVWKPNVITNENGEAEITFFTSDIRSIFNGNIQAIGANGSFGIHKFYLNVLK